MSAYIFSGKQFAAQKEEDLKKRVEKLHSKNVKPKLVGILVGDDPASKLYVSLKQKAAERVGIEFVLIQPNESTKESITGLIKQYNEDASVTGILVQLPLPKELDTKETTKDVVKTIAPEKDVDGLTDTKVFTAATVKAVMYAVQAAQTENLLPKDLSGIKSCVVGGTGVVGSGVVKELEQKCENIYIVNSKTEKPEELTSQADLLISVVGVPNLITKDMVKSGAVVIDVGSPQADVSEDVQEIASFITPVPGGIGPMTVICLIENIVEAAEKLLA